MTLPTASDPSGNQPGVPPAPTIPPAPGTPAAGTPVPTTQPTYPPTYPPTYAPAYAATPAPLNVKVQEKGRMSALSLLLGLAVVVAIGGVAFAVGRVTAPAPATTGAGGFGGFRGGAGTGGSGAAPGASGVPGGAGFFGAGGAGAGLTVTGTVQTITPTSITLKLQSGATVDIPIDSSTTYHGQTPATASQVTSGAQVQVQVGAGGLGAGGFGAGGFGGGRGQGGNGGGANGGATPPPAVGSTPAPGASAPSGGTGTGRGGAGRGGAIGPATSITIVTQ